MAKFSNLPPELLSEVANNLEHPDLASAARVERRLHAVALSLLYRNIYPKTLPELVGCLKTISTNSVCARAVRKLDADGVFVHAAPLGALFRLLQRALSKTSGLQVLDLFSGFDFGGILVDLSLPRLETLVFPFAPALRGFLSRHPSLRILDVRTPHLPPPLDMNQEPPSLPFLQFFYGSTTIAQRVLHPSCRLQKLTLQWGPHDASVVLFLSSYSGLFAELSTLEWVTETVTGEMMIALAKATPCLELLTIFHPGAGGTPDGYWENLYSILNDHLGSFTSLAGIAFGAFGHIDPHSVSGRDLFDCMRVEFPLILRWIAACPTLGYCLFPSTNGWSSIKAWGIWAPLALHRVDPKRLRWFCLVIGSLPLDEIPAVYKDYWEKALGEKTFSALRETMLSGEAAIQGFVEQWDE